MATLQWSSLGDCNTLFVFNIIVFFVFVFTLERKRNPSTSQNLILSPRSTHSSLSHPSPSSPLRKHVLPKSSLNLILTRLSKHQTKPRFSRWQEILLSKRKGGFALFWLAGTLSFKKLNKKEVLACDLVSAWSVSSILHPTPTLVADELTRLLVRGSDSPTPARN